MQRIVLADVKSVNDNGVNPGHYFYLVHNYKEVFDTACDVVPAGGPIYKTRFENVVELPYDYCDKNSFIRNKWRVLKNCRALFRNISEGDTVVMQQSGAATMLVGLALFGGNKQVYAIFYDTDPLSSWIKRLIFRLARKKIKGVLCPSHEIGRAYALPYTVVSDYVCTQEIDTSSLLGFSQRKYDFAMVGRIEPEKGVAEAMGHFAGTKCRMLVAGKPSSQAMADELARIESSCNNIDLRLGYVATEDYDRYIRDSRFCLMNYHGVYVNRSSGVVLDAIFRGTPVLGHRCMAMQMVEDENLGTLYDSLDEIVPSDLLSEDTFNVYMASIARFVQKNMHQRENLRSFLLP